MSALSRRGLFGLLAGAAVAPLLSRLPAPAPARTVVQELEFASSGMFQRYSGYEVLNITPTEIMRAAEYDWKHLARAVVVSQA